MRRSHSTSALVSFSFVNLVSCTSHSHNTLPQSTLSSDPHSYLTARLFTTQVLEAFIISHHGRKNRFRCAEGAHYGVWRR